MTWPTAPLRELADLCLGKMLDKNKNKGQLRPYLANIDVRWGSIDLADLREMRFEDRELDRYGLRSGDIVMCEGGEPGRCAIWKDQVPGMMIQKALHRIRARPSVDAKFLYYALFEMGQAGTLAPLFTGATIKHLPGEQLAKVVVPSPPLETQRRIASILGAYDDLIEVNRRRVAILEQMARGLFEEWFVRFRFPGHESVPMVETPEGLLPQGWKYAPIKDTYDGLYDGPHATPPPSADGPIFLGIGNVTEKGQLDLSSVRHIAEEDFAKWTKRVTPDAGDIVFTYEATLNRYALIPQGFRGCLGRRLALIRARSIPGMNRYLFLYFFSENWRSVIAKNTLSGATVDRVPLSRFPEFPVCLPPHEIVASFDTVAQPMIAQIEGLVKAHSTLAASRDLLLPRLISGQLSVEAAERELEAAA